MGALNTEAFTGITYGVMGMGTEGGKTPYRITVAATGGWNGTPIASSGYSVGAMQFDFGQRGRIIDPQTKKSYADSFVDAVNSWADANGQPRLSSAINSTLLTKGSGITWMSSTDRASITDFGGTAVGQGWINSHLEKGLIKEYEAKISPVLSSKAFDGWSEADVIVATAVFSKAANQSPNGGFVRLAALAEKSGLNGESYGLNNFLEHVKQVESGNSAFHFTKAADIAKDYVVLRDSPEFGVIIEAAERKIADPSFTPSSIAPDSDLWFMRKVNSDPKFRSDLKSALVQLDANQTEPSVGTTGQAKSRSSIVLIP